MIILYALLFFVQHLVIPVLFLLAIFSFFVAYIMSDTIAMEGDTMEEECPCNSCEREAYCDGWESQFCCAFCLWSGAESCEDCDEGCDPYDI